MLQRNITLCAQMLTCEKEFQEVMGYEDGTPESWQYYLCAALLPAFLDKVVRLWRVLHRLPVPLPHECAVSLSDVAREWRSDTAALLAGSRPESAGSPSVAVCVTGSVRTFRLPEVHLSLRDNVVRSLNAGVLRLFYVLNLTSLRQLHSPPYVATTASLEEVLPAISAIGSELLASLAIEPDCCWPGLRPPLRYSDCFHDQINCPASTRAKRQCAAHVRDYEEMRGAPFDWVLFVRPDVSWRFPIGDIRRFEPRAIHAAFYGAYDLGDMFQLVPAGLVPPLLDVFGNESAGYTCMTEEEVRADTFCRYGSCGCAMERRLSESGVPRGALRRIPWEIAGPVRLQVPSTASDGCPSGSSKSE